MASETPAPDLSNQLLKELQSWWEIPAIAQYISLFREAFKLPEIEIEELENALIDDTIKKSNIWLQNLLCAFLRSLNIGSLNKDNWEIQLRKLILRKWPDPENNPFQSTLSFSELNIRAKVEILYSLCLYRLDKNDIIDIMKSMDADALRVQKLGIDQAGNTYWYFYGTRLYKEEPNKKPSSWDEEWKQQKKRTFRKKRRGRPRKMKTRIKSDGESDDYEDVDGKSNGFMNVDKKSRWSVVCDTIEDWVNFAEKFKNSKSKDEKALFQVIQTSFLPTLNNIYEEKEKKLQEKIRQLMPVREKIVTRRETRKLKEDLNEDTYKTYRTDDRARRLEERNKRASEGSCITKRRMKHKRMSYSDAHDYIPYVPRKEKQKESEDYVKTSSPEYDENELDIQDQIEKLLSSVKLHKDAWPFLYPVKEEEAPGYYEIIKEPVTLNEIENKLYEGYYETLDDLDSDFCKMVTNCELYNGENHDYSKMAQTLWRMFRKGISKILNSLHFNENVNRDSDESNKNSIQDSQEVCKSSIKSSKKSKDGRKKKKRAGMEALEMLAHASELALQSTSSNDMSEHSYSSDHGNPIEFSGLKVSAVNSHPQELVEKFSSDASNDSAGENVSANSSPSYSNSENILNGEYNISSPGEEEIPVINESVNYVNNNLPHLTNFIEKNSVKNLNNLSNNDVSNVLSDASSSHHTSNGSSPVYETSINLSKGNSPVDFDPSLSKLFDECSDNVSNILSHLMKQPIYNTDNHPKENISYMDSNSKQDNLYKNTRKSPLNSTFTGPVIQDTVSDNNSESGIGSSASSSTVDASAIGIGSFNPHPKKARYLNGSEGAYNFTPEHKNIVSNMGQSDVISPSNLIQPEQEILPNEIMQQQFYCDSNNSQIGNTSAVPYQSLNLGVPNSVGNIQSTFVPSTNIAQFPLQIPSSFAQTVQPQARNINHSPKTRVTPPRSHIVYLSEPNKRTETFAEPKGNGSIIEQQFNFQGENDAAGICASPSKEYQLTDDKEKHVNRTSPKKRSPVPEQLQTVSIHVPSKNVISVSNNSKTTLPVTSTNFVPVNSVKHGTPKDKHSAKRVKIREYLDNAPQNNVILGNSNMNSNNNGYFNHEGQLFHAVPIVISGYNQQSNELKSKKNQNIPMTVQSSMCLPNGVPIMQQVIIPAGPQQFPVQNGQQFPIRNGQFMFAPPPPSNLNKYNKQNNQISNNIRQMNQGFEKVPQVLAPVPVMQIPKDFMQNLQFQHVPQNNSQAYTQVTPSPQFVGIPTYMIGNQGQLQDSSMPNVMNVQSYSQKWHKGELNGQRNG